MSINSVSRSVVVNESVEVEKTFAALKLKVFSFLIVGFCLLIAVGVLLGFVSLSFNLIFVLIGLLCLSLLFLGLACAYRLILSKKYVVEKSSRLLQEVPFQKRFKECLREAERLEYDLDEEIHGAIEVLRLVNKSDSTFDFCILDKLYYRFNVLKRKRSILIEKMSLLKRNYCDFLEQNQGLSQFLGMNVCYGAIKNYANLIVQIRVRTEKSLKLADEIAFCLLQNQTGADKEKRHLIALKQELKNATERVRACLRQEKSGNMQANMSVREGECFALRNVSIKLGAEVIIGYSYINRARGRISDCQCQIQTCVLKQTELKADLKLIEDRLLTLVPESKEYVRLKTIIIPETQQLIALINHCTEDLRTLVPIYEETVRLFKCWVIMKKRQKFTIDQRLEIVSNNIKHLENKTVRGYSQWANNAYSKENIVIYKQYLQKLGKETIMKYLEATRYLSARESFITDANDVLNLSECVEERMLQWQKLTEMSERVRAEGEAVLQLSELDLINGLMLDAPGKFSGEKSITAEGKIRLGLLVLRDDLKSLRRRLGVKTSYLNDSRKEVGLLNRMLDLKQKIDNILTGKDFENTQASGLSKRMLKLKLAIADYNAWLNSPDN